MQNKKIVLESVVLTMVMATNYIDAAVQRKRPDDNQIQYRQKRQKIDTWANLSNKVLTLVSLDQHGKAFAYAYASLKENLLIQSEESSFHYNLINDVYQNYLNLNVTINPQSMNSTEINTALTKEITSTPCNLANIAVLIDAHADTNQTIETQLYQNKPNLLSYAAYNANVCAVFMLLAGGANPNGNEITVPSWVTSPLHCAICKYLRDPQKGEDLIEVISLLFEYGAMADFSAYFGIMKCSKYAAPQFLLLKYWDFLCLNQTFLPNEGCPYLSEIFYKSITDCDIDFLNRVVPIFKNNGYEFSEFEQMILSKFNIR